MRYSITAGDLEPDMELTASINGVAKNLTTAAAIQMQWLKPNGAEALVALTAVDLAGGKVKRVWTTGDTDVVGTHRGRIVVTWPGNEPQRFPSDGTWFLWSVHE